MASVSVQIGSIATGAGEHRVRSAERSFAVASEYNSLSLRQRIRVLLRDIFEGHAEYLGATPD
jgi:hypothetical protein